MESPLSGAGPQKSFWNTYAFNPFVADTRPGAAGYAGLSILMFMVAPFWGHALLYLFVRKPFKAKQKEFMTEVQAEQARKVDLAVAQQDPLRRAEFDSYYKALLDHQKAIVAENKRLHDQLFNLRDKYPHLSPIEYDETRSQISDAIEANMLKSLDIARQISEYGRAPSPLSSLGLPSSKVDSPPGVNSAPRTH